MGLFGGTPESSSDFGSKLRLFTHHFTEPSLVVRVIYFIFTKQTLQLWG